MNNENNKKDITSKKKCVVKGCVLSIYSDMGPVSLLSYPFPEDSTFLTPDLDVDLSPFSQRNNMQVAVKSMSLLLTDFSFEDPANTHLSNVKLFGVLPYPDMKSVGYSYFFYYYSPNKKHFIPATFTLIVNIDERSFIYDSMDRIRSSIINFSDYLVDFCQKRNITSELDVQSVWMILVPRFKDFLSKMGDIQSKPISPITKKRRIKILFTGLENTGKSSFLLTIKRKFSELPSLLPTTEIVKDSLDFLGTTIMKWDIPGQENLREKIFKKSELYIFESDVIYFFIDIQNPRIQESKKFLENIMKVLKENNSNIPILFILTKMDEDIANLESIQKTVQNIKEELVNIVKDCPFKFFETSIFSIFSVLNAFSYGIRQLSPNREMLEHLLKEFLSLVKMETGLLLNENGIVIANKDLSKDSKLTSIPHSQIFEIAAPQFATIAKQFNEYATINENKLIRYHFSDNEIVLLKKFKIMDFLFFALFYTKKNSSIKKLEKNLPEFMKRIENLLTLYIA